MTNADAIIKEAVYKCKGKPALLARQLKISMAQLKKLLANSSWINKEMQEQAELFEQASIEIADLQLKNAAALGKRWAIEAITLQGNSVRKQIKQSERTITQITAQVDTLNNNGEYLEEFSDLAYIALSQCLFATLSHLCIVFHCDRQQLQVWIDEHPSFAKSISIGLAEAEIHSRKAMLSLALDPSSASNTALIKTLAENVYNIKEASNELNVVISEATDERTIEEIMADRNIPIPDITTSDVGTNLDFLASTVAENQGAKNLIDQGIQNSAQEFEKAQEQVSNLIVENKNLQAQIQALTTKIEADETEKLKIDDLEY